MTLAELEVVFKQIQARLLKFLISRLDVRDDALDIIQNIFVDLVLMARKDCLDKDRVESLIFHLAYIKLTDRLRRREREDRLLEHADTVEFDTPDSRQDNLTLDRDIFKLLERGLRELSFSSRVREALRLHLYGGLNKAQITRVLQISRQTLDRDLEYGLSELQKLFIREGITPEE